MSALGHKATSRDVRSVAEIPLAPFGPITGIPLAYLTFFLMAVGKLSDLCLLQ
jgi:hypothetical protein